MAASNQRSFEDLLQAVVTNPAITPVNRGIDSPIGVLIPNVRIKEPKYLAGTVGLEIYRGIRFFDEENGKTLFYTDCVRDLQVIAYDVYSKECSLLITFGINPCGQVQMLMEQSIPFMCLLAKTVFQFGDNLLPWHTCVQNYFIRCTGHMELLEQAEQVWRMQDAKRNEKRVQEVMARQEKYLASTASTRRDKPPKSDQQREEEQLLRTNLTLEWLSTNHSNTFN